MRNWRRYSVTTPTYDDLQDLEFTENIITEALRLYPPIHTIPRRTKSDVEVNGFRIPGGSRDSPIRDPCPS